MKLRQALLAEEGLPEQKKLKHSNSQQGKHPFFDVKRLQPLIRYLFGQTAPTQPARTHVAVFRRQKIGRAHV